jgi:hypothetical protein
MATLFSYKLLQLVDAALFQFDDLFCFTVDSIVRKEFFLKLKDVLITLI